MSIFFLCSSAIAAAFRWKLFFPAYQSSLLVLSVAHRDQVFARMRAQASVCTEIRFVEARFIEVHLIQAFASRNEETKRRIFARHSSA